MEAEMAREARTTPPARHAPPSSFLTLMTGWVQQGVESFFATQRVLVDLAMRQNALAMKSFRDMLTDPENSPVAILTELAVEGTSNFIEAQQILLNLAQQENEIIMNGMKERVGGTAVGAAATDLLRRAINNYVDMQQDYLKITKKQAINWLDAVKDGKGYDGKHMVELAREGMETFVESQKKFLDIIMDETNRATGGKPRTDKIKKTELSKLAREGVNAFIDAQKKLLDVAGQQMNVNLTSATKTMSMLSPARLMPMANLTGEGVRSFVEAEKALINSVVKPRTAERAHPKAKAKAAGRRNKAAMAHAAA
jgi:hypothetical protein